MPDLHHLPLPNWYSLTMLLGIAASLVYWVRVSRRDGRLVGVYVGALFGAFAGAKLVYLLSEGWLHRGEAEQWLHWMTGKSVTGALLGGYLGVELAKKITGYARATGDRFAVVVPAVIALGRVGCLTQGCCGGVMMVSGARWPAAAVEMGFNLLAMVVLWFLRHAGRQQGQLFHLYLMAYGLFRFLHEWLRATDKPFFGGELSGYQLASLAMAVLGAWRYAERRAR